MALWHTGYIELPVHISLEKGFDHADVSPENGRLYLAHTANDAVDVVDIRRNCYHRSISPDRIDKVFEIPCKGPHGLGLDAKRKRLFCACDEKAVIVIDLHDGKVSGRIDIHGVPDVVMYNEEMQRLYLAIGDPGLIDVIDTQAMELLETVPTEKGAQTMAFDPSTHCVYAFLPETHRVMVFEDFSRG